MSIMPDHPSHWYDVYSFSRGSRSRFSTAISKEILSILSPSPSVHLVAMSSKSNSGAKRGRPPKSATTASGVSSTVQTNVTIASPVTVESPKVEPIQSPTTPTPSITSRMATDAMDDVSEEDEHMKDVNVYHDPFVGPDYQAEVGAWIPPATRDPSVVLTTRHLTDAELNDPNHSQKGITINQYFEQTAEWNPHLKGFHTDKRKQEALEKYLLNVETAFSKDGRHMAQDVALHFLHQCDYDVPMANRFVKPWQPPADPDLDLDEEEMYPADSFCSVCRDGGNLMLCDVCDKSYHAACVQLESVPSGTWTCPYHQCASCLEGVDRNLPSLSCSMCPTSYCSQHIPSDVRVRAEAIGCAEAMCGECLKKEEEYEFIQRARKGGVSGHTHQDHSCRKAFLHRLQMVLKREGTQLIRMPILGGRELDLYKLYTTVCKAGGIYAVLDTVGWRDIRRALKLPPTVHHQGKLLKKFYLSVLYSYEKQFFPFFSQLPLKKALADKDDEEEEEELALLAQQQAAAASSASSKSGGGGTKKKSAAQMLMDEHAASSRTIILDSTGQPPKDDLRTEDVVISLKIGASAGGHASMGGKSKLETQAMKKKDKERERKQKERERKEKERESAAKAERGSKRQREKKLSSKAARGKGRKGAAPMSASAAAASLGLSGPLKEHPAINIWTPTWWAHQANSSASVLKHAAGVQLQGNSQVISELVDIQNAARAAMAAVSGMVEIDASTLAAATPMDIDSSSASASPPITAASSSSPATDVHLSASATLIAAASAEGNDASNSKRKYQEMLLAAQSAPVHDSQPAAPSDDTSPSFNNTSPPSESRSIAVTSAERRPRGRPPKSPAAATSSSLQGSNGHSSGAENGEEFDPSEAETNKRRKANNGASLQQ